LLSKVVVLQVSVVKVSVYSVQTAGCIKLLKLSQSQTYLKYICKTNFVVLYAPVYGDMCIDQYMVTDAALRYLRQ
jgi:hypothetical protein